MCQQTSVVAAEEECSRDCNQIFEGSPAAAAVASGCFLEEGAERHVQWDCVFISYHVSRVQGGCSRVGRNHYLGNVTAREDSSADVLSPYGRLLTTELLATVAAFVLVKPSGLYKI
ncbi:hypothetical protein JOB18_039069 [Solea senegalensis]|uniref:Uncharacterized protein n=1 Tax=Solea senegalensis TaxID=28829 RepID=A0AAV6R7S3_SOLSE|nr:hypothetical protein JOB18_039069 [Solea senegalensis]